MRDAGVTRSASITPSRISPIRPNPTKSAPNTASCTSSPGTNSVYAFVVPSCAASGSSNGPNSTR